MKVTKVREEHTYSASAMTTVVDGGWRFNKLSRVLSKDSTEVVGFGYFDGLAH